MDTGQQGAGDRVFSSTVLRNLQVKCACLLPCAILQCLWCLKRVGGHGDVLGTVLFPTAPHRLQTPGAFCSPFSTTHMHGQVSQISSMGAGYNLFMTT